MPSLVPAVAAEVVRAVPLERGESPVVAPAEELVAKDLFSRTLFRVHCIAFVVRAVLLGLEEIPLLEYQAV